MFPLYNVVFHLGLLTLVSHSLTLLQPFTKLSSPPMAAARLPAAVLVLSFLLSATITTPCGTCKPPVPFCPRDTLKLGVCADLLGLVNVVIGDPPSGDKCCALLEGLADLEVAACLCTAIKANVLGINLNVPVALSALVSGCQKTIPPGFKCV